MPQQKGLGSWKDLKKGRTQKGKQKDYFSAHKPDGLGRIKCACTSFLTCSSPPGQLATYVRTTFKSRCCLNFQSMCMQAESTDIAHNIVYPVRSTSLLRHNLHRLCILRQANYFSTCNARRSKTEASSTCNLWRCSTCNVWRWKMSHTDQGQADQGQETLGREACAHAHIHTHSHSHSPRLLHAYLLAWVEVLPAVAGSTALAGGCGGPARRE